MTSTTKFNRLVVENSSFFEIACAGAGLSSGILLYGKQVFPLSVGAVGHGINLDGNQFMFIGDNANTVHGIGINLDIGSGDLANAIIQNNVLSVLGSSSTANFGIALRQPFGLISSCKVKDNILVDVTNALSFFGSQISVEASFMFGVDVCGNLSTLGGSGAGITLGLLAPTTGGAGENINVCDNIIIGGEVFSVSASVLGMQLVGIAGSTLGTFSRWSNVQVSGNTLTVSNVSIVFAPEYILQIIGHMNDIRIIGNTTRANNELNPSTGHIALNGVTSGESQRVSVVGNTGSSTDVATSVVQVWFSNIQEFTISGNTWDFGVGSLNYLLDFVNFCGDGAISGNFIGGLSAIDDMHFGVNCFGILGSGNCFDAAFSVLSDPPLTSAVVFEIGTYVTVDNNDLNLRQ
jgi:hypothetical protein